MEVEEAKNREEVLGEALEIRVGANYYPETLKQFGWTKIFTLEKYYSIFENSKEGTRIVVDKNDKLVLVYHF